MSGHAGAAALVLPEFVACVKTVMLCRVVWTDEDCPPVACCQFRCLPASQVPAAAAPCCCCLPHAAAAAAAVPPKKNEPGEIVGTNATASYQLVLTGLKPGATYTTWRMQGLLSGGADICGC